MYGVDNNPANDEPTNHQQEIENAEDDDDSTDNETENESKGKDQTIKQTQHSMFRTFRTPFCIALSKVLSAQSH